MNRSCWSIVSVVQILNKNEIMDKNQNSFSLQVPVEIWPEDIQNKLASDFLKPKQLFDHSILSQVQRFVFFIELFIYLEWWIFLYRYTMLFIQIFKYCTINKLNIYIYHYVWNRNFEIKPYLKNLFKLSPSPAPLSIDIERSILTGNPCLSELKEVKGAF